MRHHPELHGEHLAGGGAAHRRHHLQRPALGSPPGHAGQRPLAPFPRKDLRQRIGRQVGLGGDAEPLARARVQVEDTELVVEDAHRRRRRLQVRGQDLLHDKPLPVRRVDRQQGQQQALPGLAQEQAAQPAARHAHLEQRAALAEAAETGRGLRLAQQAPEQGRQRRGGIRRQPGAERRIDVQGLAVGIIDTDRHAQRPQQVDQGGGVARERGGRGHGGRTQDKSGLHFADRPGRAR